MSLEKSTYVSTQANGRLEFKSEGDGLRIEVVNGEGNVTDTATISSDDLRSLVKEFAPAKRGPKKSKGAGPKAKAA